MHPPETVELLPWLINRTLGAEEENRVQGELRASEPLRRELRATVDVARLLSRPPSVEALVDYASGRPTAERELIERLIEVEPEWAEQVRLARLSFAHHDDKVVVFKPVPPRRSVPSYWRSAALAAGLAAVLATAGWLNDWLSGWHPGAGPGPTSTVSTPWLARPQLAVPQPNVTVLDLVATSFIKRDSAGETGRQSLRLSELGESLVLILASDSDLVFDRYELELVGPSGTSRTPELVRTPQNDYTLLVPRTLLAPGTYALQVYGLNGGRRERLESYELQVEP